MARVTLMDDLTLLGVRVAEQLNAALAEGQPMRLGEVSVAFSRLAWVVRLAVTLAAGLDHAPLPDAPQPGAGMAPAKPRPPLLNDLDQDDPHVMDRPLGECVACICAELGLTPAPELIKELDEDLSAPTLGAPPGSPGRLIEQIQRTGPPPCLRFLQADQAGVVAGPGRRLN